MHFGQPEKAAGTAVRYSNHGLNNVLFAKQTNFNHTKSDIKCMMKEKGRSGVLLNQQAQKVSGHHY